MIPHWLIPMAASCLVCCGFLGAYYVDEYRSRFAKGRITIAGLLIAAAFVSACSMVYEILGLSAVIRICIAAIYATGGYLGLRLWRRRRGPHEWIWTIGATVLAVGAILLLGSVEP